MEFSAEHYVDGDTLKSKVWPKSPQWLSNRLSRDGKALRDQGYSVIHLDDRNISLNKVGKTKGASVEGKSYNPENLRELRKLRCDEKTQITQNTQKIPLVGNALAEGEEAF